MSRMNAEKKLGTGRVVAVAIENNKTSQYAAKWAVDNLLPKDQNLLLVHVRQRSPSIADMNDDVARAYRQQADNESKELFASFRVFCNRKNIQCKEVLLEEMDISKAIIECVSLLSIELLVLGAPSKTGLIRRFRTTDVPSLVTKGAPPFCTIYVISKGKISNVRSSTAKLTPKPTPNQIPNQQPLERPPHGTHPLMPGEEEMKSPFTRGGSGNNRTYKPYEPSPDSDISFVSSGSPSIDRFFSSSPFNIDDPTDSGIGSDIDARSFGSSFNSTTKSIDITSRSDLSFCSQDSGMSCHSRTSQQMEEVEAEMRRLKLELKQTIEMYSTACKEALTAKQKAMELQHWKMEEQKRLQEAKVAEEAALAIAEMEKARCKAALEAAEASKRMAEVEAQKRKNAEMKALKKGGEGNARYRRYDIEEIEEATKCFSESLKIGEGGYGPVYRGELDHTAVAIKVLRPDAAQGRSQFQQEVEVLSCIRHPNMVLLLGACPEFGCLVYEYMANGSLEDRLFCRGNSPPLSWQLRFRIAAEIGTGLLFLHQTRPEPLVHRDLKPANILLDRNFVSKISDVGLARLVPPSVADTVTQYRMTATAGTFCYIDPEYQQTGMLGIKSDIYSLGIMFLQLVTAKPPMGLTHSVSRAIENGTFPEILDPAVEDWPLDQTLHFATISLQCAEMRKKDRPDLAKVVLPELNRLREFAEESMPMSMTMFGAAAGLFSPSRTSNPSSVSTSSLNDSLPAISTSGYESTSSTSSIARL